MALKFTDFSSFLNAVKEITHNKLMEAKKLLKGKGKNIENISDIFISDNNELFDLLPDGTLVKVNLYIATQIYNTKLKVKDLYKYHIYKCNTLSNMFKSGRKHRYKINTRDDGKFHYLFTDRQGKTIGQNQNQKLYICKNCLGKFIQQKASDLDVRRFNLKNFYQQNDSFFNFDTSKLEKGEDATANVYSKLWNKISTQLKVKKDYTCQECGFKARNEYERRFIHTHHINGNKTNNYEDNLKVLCIKCHSEVDSYHTRIKSSPNYKQFFQLKKS